MGTPFCTTISWPSSKWFCRMQLTKCLLKAPVRQILWWKRSFCRKLTTARTWLPVCTRASSRCTTSFSHQKKLDLEFLMPVQFGSVSKEPTSPRIPHAPVWFSRFGRMTGRRRIGNMLWKQPPPLSSRPLRPQVATIWFTPPQGARVSYKSDPQECCTRVHKSVLQGCPTKSVLQECPARVSHRATKVSHKSVQQECLLQECQENVWAFGFMDSILLLFQRVYGCKT